MAMYRTGIVGGRRGVHHARRYEGIENMKVIAICEIDEERLKSSGGRTVTSRGIQITLRCWRRKNPILSMPSQNLQCHGIFWVEPAAEAGG